MNTWDRVTIWRCVCLRGLDHDDDDFIIEMHSCTYVTIQLHPAIHFLVDHSICSSSYLPPPTPPSSAPWSSSAFFCYVFFFFRNKINNWFGCACEWMPIVARFVFVAIHAVNDRSWRRTFIYLYIIPALALSFLLQYNDTSHNWVYYCYELQHLSSEHLSCQVLVFLRWFIIGLTSGEC